VTALLTGSDGPALAPRAAKLAGVKTVLLAPNEAYDRFLPENFAPLVAQVVKDGGFTHVVAAHGQFGKNTMPRIGSLLDVQPIADIIEVQGEDTFVRQIYAGTASCDDSHSCQEMQWRKSSRQTP
jgi:electron transfer flavoprotein alpha subunit